MPESPVFRHSFLISSLCMTAILGLSGYYHDSAAALVVDGEIVAAAQEERFTRKKHDERFPSNAMIYCLEESGLQPCEIDFVGFYDKPLLKFERLLETYLAFSPRGFVSFSRIVPSWLKKKLHLPREIRKELKKKYRKRIVFSEHHESHAASAFFPSPFDESAILTVDGVGEWATASYGLGRGNELELTHELRFPHSPGLLYSAFTSYCGFRVNSGEYKLMGLAPYGEPIYRDLIFDKLLDVKDDGSFRMEMSYFSFGYGLRATSKKFHRLFGGPPRSPETPISEKDMNLAASIQIVMEEILLKMAKYVKRESGQNNLCLAGGVALNCVANGKILREAGFENVWIQPAAGDAGGALGVALFIWHQLLGNERSHRTCDSQAGSLLGPKFSNAEAEICFQQNGAVYERIDDEDELCKRIADLLASEKVVGWMQGRMEFGPRALGGRSILGDARSPNMQSVMNRKIKFRESFRPFAPIVLAEHAHEYFELDEGQESPYMLLVASIREEHRERQQENETANGFDLLPLKRSDIPAVTHVDFSARVQTVDEKRNPLLCKLMREFYKKTNSPVMINTSFNVRGEPIVCTPEDALQCFMATNMDVLVVENCVLLKEKQPQATEHTINEHLAKFDLD